MSAPVLSAEDLAAIEARAQAAPSPEGMALIRVPFHPESFDWTRYAYAEGVSDERKRTGDDVPRLLAALQHVTKVAEAERALRVSFVDAFERVMKGRVTAEEAEGIVAAISPAAAKLRALGVEP